MPTDPLSSLRSAGLRATPQRNAILTILRVSGHPLTVAEIRELIEGHRPGRPTIYRNLERFIQEGWATLVSGSDRTFRFASCDSQSGHHHLQCLGCGKKVEMENPGWKRLIQELEANSGFQLIEYWPMFSGWCPACQKAPPKKRANQRENRFENGFSSASNLRGRH